MNIDPKSPGQATRRFIRKPATPSSRSPLYSVRGRSASPRTRRRNFFLLFLFLFATIAIVGRVRFVRRYRQRTVATRKPHCDYTCVKTLHATCLNGRGDVVPPPRGVLVPDSSSAIVFQFNGHTNPEHAIHEDGFPLFFEINNCFLPTQDDVYLRNQKHSIYTELFQSAVVRWITVVTSRTAPSRTANVHLASDPVAADRVKCYKSVRFVLDPLRTPCTLDPQFAEHPNALNVSRFVGKRGLGMHVHIRNASSRVLVPEATRRDAFNIVRAHLEAKYGWTFERLRGEDSREKRVVTVLVRGRDVSKRRQTNGMAMVRAIENRFGSELVVVRLVEWRRELPLSEQLKVFYESDVVVAVHGGALGNCFAMRRGALLVTQCSRMKCRQWEANLAPLVGVTVEKFDYSAYQGEDDPIVNFHTEEIVDLLAKHLVR